MSARANHSSIPEVRIAAARTLHKPTAAGSRLSRLSGFATLLRLSGLPVAIQVLAVIVLPLTLTALPQIVLPETAHGADGPSGAETGGQIMTEAGVHASATADAQLNAGVGGQAGAEAGGQAVAEADADAQFDTWTQPWIRPGYVLMAENEVLSLYVHPESTALTLVKREKGLKDPVVVYSGPDVGNRRLSSLWDTALSSPVTVSTVMSDLRRVRTTNTLHSRATHTITPIESGVRIGYDLVAVSIRFDLVLELEGDYLRITIPESSIVEYGDRRLVSMELLPFMAAAEPGEKGYAVIPDGSGAIAHFREDTVAQTRQYRKYVYGPDDYTFVNLERWVPERPEGERIRIPVYGMVKESESGFAAVIARGDAHAAITYSPAGYIVNYYRAGAELIYRSHYEAPIDSSSTVTQVSETMIPGDRVMLFAVFGPSDASYQGIAEFYNRYLRSQVGDKEAVSGSTLPESAPAGTASSGSASPEATALGSTPLVDLRVMCGSTKPGLIMDSVEVTTHFREVLDIVRAAKAEGIESLRVTLVGWTPRGYGGSWPRRWPPEGAFGGLSALRSLASELAKEDVPLYLEDNYVEAIASNGGFSKRSDVIRAPSYLPVVSDNGGVYLIRPDIALSRYAEIDMPKIAQSGVSGLCLSVAADSLLSHTDRRLVIHRQQAADIYGSLAAVAAENGLDVSVRGGNAYMLKSAGSVYDVPVNATMDPLFDYGVPFLQLCLRGVVPYYSSPVNLRSDTRTGLLRALECGALLSAELTYREPAGLVRTRARHLFASQYSDWIDDLAWEYRLLQDLLSVPGSIPTIVSHRVLDGVVRETRYASGAVVFVNYDKHPRSVEDLVIEPFGFVIVDSSGAVLSMEEGETR